MSKHPYGEHILNCNAPPDGATGLIIREWFVKDNYTPNKLTTYLLNRKPRYFIFRWLSGSYDYKCGNEWMCGGFRAAMGYWHFSTEEERNTFFDNLNKD